MWNKGNCLKNLNKFIESHKYWAHEFIWKVFCSIEHIYIQYIHAHDAGGWSFICICWYVGVYIRKCKEGYDDDEGNKNEYKAECGCAIIRCGCYVG